MGNTFALTKVPEQRLLAGIKSNAADAPVSLSRGLPRAEYFGELMHVGLQVLLGFGEPRRSPIAVFTRQQLGEAAEIGTERSSALARQLSPDCGHTACVRSGSLVP
jgi:hypothetical protein